MFEGKTLVAAGDSHTYGQYLYDNVAESCHERSWVKKLETLGKFDKSVNLSRPGGSNDRIFRVLHEHVERNYRTIKNSVIIIALTDPIRFELPSLERTYFAKDNSNYDHKSYVINAINISNLSSCEDNTVAPQFLDTYYKYFYVEKYTFKMLNQKIIAFSSLLNRLGVEYYFTDFLSNNTFFNNPQYMGMKFPFLRIYETRGDNVMNAVKLSGFKVGNDVDPESNCNHLDHDGNEFIAECFLRDIKKWRAL